MELDAATVLHKGGWDPRFVRVLFIAQCGDVTIALVDADSDTNLSAFERDPHGSWQEGSSGSVNDEGPGQSGLAVYDYGKADPGTTVTVDYLGETHVVLADHNGWWAFVAPRDDDAGTLPQARRP